MTSREDLAVAFADLLDRARLDYVETVTSLGLPLTEFIQRVAIVDDSGGWHTDWRSVEWNTARQYIHQWGPLKDNIRNDCLDLSADIVGTFASSLPFWSGGFSGISHKLLGLPPSEIQFSDEPNTWVACCIVLPAIVEYLRMLSSADSPDSSLATRIIDEALTLVTARDLRITSYFPVFGINMEDERLVSGDIVVRKLTPLERGDLWQHIQGRASLNDRTTLSFSLLPVFAVPSYLIELTTTGPRMAHLKPGSGHKLALCAFYLHGYPLAGPGRMTSAAAPRWINYGDISTTVQLRSEPLGDKDLDQGKLSDIWKTLRNVRRYDLEQPSNSRDLALHRFLLGSTREYPVDSLLDYVIALECFLLPYDPVTRHGDLGYRFRLHGAHYIGNTPEERRAIWKQLRDLYDFRSRLVHGSGYPTQAEIATFAKVVRDLTERAFLKAVNSHFPRVEEFNSWVLGDMAREDARAGTGIGTSGLCDAAALMLKVSLHVCRDTTCKR